MGEDFTGAGGAPDPVSISTRPDFAAALTLMRCRAGLSIRRMSALTGVPSATLGGYFSGRHLPSVSQVETFRAVLEALGVTDPREAAGWLDALTRLRDGPPG